MPWYVELSNKKEQKEVEQIIIEGGGALINVSQKEFLKPVAKSALVAFLWQSTHHI